MPRRPRPEVIGDTVCIANVRSMPGVLPWMGFAPPPGYNSRRAGGGALATTRPCGRPECAGRSRWDALDENAARMADERADGPGGPGGGAALHAAWPA